MKKKINCWEYKKCGRQRADDGFPRRRKCLVPEMSIYNGVNGGRNAGRACWLVADTTCNGEDQLTFMQKVKECASCDFYKKVKEEEQDLDTPLTIIEDICNSK